VGATLSSAATIAESSISSLLRFSAAHSNRKAEARVCVLLRVMHWAHCQLRTLGGFSVSMRPEPFQSHVCWALSRCGCDSPKIGLRGTRLWNRTGARRQSNVIDR
jgi:hypothetical protein